MPEKKGTENIKKILDVLVESGNVVAKILEDKGSAIQKASHVLKLSDELIGLAGFNGAEMKAEFSDLDAAEKAELLAHAKEKFDLDDDQVEAKIEACLDIVVEAGAFVQKALALVGSFKVSPAAPVSA